MAELMTIWDEILATVRRHVPEEDFRRYFSPTAYASDSGDQITVWVPTEAIRRHLATHFDDDVRRAMEASGRSDTVVRFVVGGIDEDEDEE